MAGPGEISKQRLPMDYVVTHGLVTTINKLHVLMFRQPNVEINTGIYVKTRPVFCLHTFIDCVVVVSNPITITIIIHNSYLRIYIYIIIIIIIIQQSVQCSHIFLRPFNNYNIFFLQLPLPFQSSSINPFSPIRKKKTR